MTIPSEGIKNILVTAGYIFGGTADWALFIGRRPNDPNRCIVIYDSGGRPPNPRWLLDYPSIQIKVRGGPNDYEEAYNISKLVRSHLLGLPSQVINGDQWNHVNAVGDIAFMGYNQNNQPEFSLNFTLIIEPAAVVSDNREPLPT